MVDAVDTDDDDAESSDLNTTSDQSEPLDLSGDERKLVTQPYDMGVKSLRDDIASRRLKLTVEYQRKFVWDQAKSSRLIESLLLNVPIPVCYFSEDEDGSYEVIDGLQRLTTIDRFLADGFALKGVPVLKELEGKKFSELNPRDQRRLQNRTIRCIVISEDSHPDIKFDVFERLNTGAASLHEQELRNCIYRGPFNTSLKNMVQSQHFLQLMIGDNNARMDHEELVLRYLALVEKFSEYKPPIRQFLNQYMRKNRQIAVSEEQEARFFDTCDAVFAALGEGAFKGLVKKGLASRNINKALFDSIMIPVAFSDQEKVHQESEAIKVLRDRLLRSDDFASAIGRATADRSRMALRIESFANGLRRIGIAVDLPPLPTQKK